MVIQNGQTTGLRGGNLNAGVFSLYWDNIDPKVPHYQKLVMDKFGLPINQHKIHGLDHGEWMDWVLNKYDDLEGIIFFDIDCIPTNLEKLGTWINLAGNGTLVGNEQASNHLDASRLFAAPSFLVVNRKMWKMIGKPSCKATYDGDVAQMLTDMWGYHQVPVKMLPVTHYELAKWDLPDRPQSYGIGTTYGDCTYHLFEVRENANVDRFVKKAIEVIS